LSSGFFEQNEGCINFNDTATGLAMKAMVKGNSLEFTEGLKPLVGLKFIHSEGQEMRDFIINFVLPILADHKYVEQTRDSLHTTDLRPVNYGKYYGAWGYQLHLNDDGAFRYGYYDFSPATLEGTWIQDGNMIVLHDKFTGHDFYLLNEEPNLLPMLMPGYTQIYYKVTGTTDVREMGLSNYRVAKTNELKFLVSEECRTELSTVLDGRPTGNRSD
jgi:hypothetical protein